MVLRGTTEDRQHDSFTTCDDGLTARRVKVCNQLTANISGLSIAGKITAVTLNSSTWVPLPATPLANRNAMSIQNISGTEIKIQYDNTVPGYSGVTIDTGSERFYEITDSIIIYAKALTGTPVIQVEELS